jgi:hypothetical protein
VTRRAEPQRTRAAVEARRASAVTMVDRVAEVLRRMTREKAEISVSVVARRAQVSRTFLYQNPRA